MKLIKAQLPRVDIEGGEWVDRYPLRGYGTEFMDSFECSWKTLGMGKGNCMDPSWFSSPDETLKEVSMCLGRN